MVSTGVLRELVGSVYERNLCHQDRHEIRYRLSISLVLSRYLSLNVVYSALRLSTRAFLDR